LWRDGGKGGKTGETGEEFDLYNNGILIGLTGLADPTGSHIERLEQWNDATSKPLRAVVRHL
jgi:hypothetical protein